jgi:hypothetical protein
MAGSPPAHGHPPRAPRASLPPFRTWHGWGRPYPHSPHRRGGTWPHNAGLGRRMEALDAAFMEKNSFSDRSRNYPRAGGRRSLRRRPASDVVSRRAPRVFPIGGETDAASDSASDITWLLRRCRHTRRVPGAARGATMCGCLATAYRGGTAASPVRGLVPHGAIAECRSGPSGVGGRHNTAYGSVASESCKPAPGGQRQLCLPLPAESPMAEGCPEPTCPCAPVFVPRRSSAPHSLCQSGMGSGFATGAMDGAAQAAQNPP